MDTKTADGDPYRQPLKESCPDTVFLLTERLQLDLTHVGQFFFPLFQGL